MDTQEVPPAGPQYGNDETRYQREPEYHGDKDAQYFLPNDAPERQRLNTQAYYLSAMMNHRVIHAPVDGGNGARLLDVGCGTAAVTDVLGTTFPQSQCYGLDLSPVVIAEGHPPNVRFLQGNFITDKPSEWHDKSGATPLVEAEYGIFDHIFSRLLVHGIQDWPGFLKREFELLKPGGWAEAHDGDCAAFVDSSGKDVGEAWQWKKTCLEVTAKKGFDWACGANMKQRMLDTGFQNVQTFEYKWPLGGETYPAGPTKDFAMFTDIMFPEVLWHGMPRLLKGSVEDEEIARLQAEMRASFSPNQQMYVGLTVTIGQKPT